jgi:hypothetical protein
MYSSNAHHSSNETLRAALESMFLENGVDLALWGHDHCYERTYPIRLNGSTASPKSGSEGTCLVLCRISLLVLVLV